MNTYNTVLKQLAKPFSKEDIKQRQGKAGMVLDYIESHGVITRLNETMPGRWSFSILDKDIVTGPMGNYIVVHGRLSINWPNGSITSYEQFGGKDIVISKIDKTKPPSLENSRYGQLDDDYKAAASDCLKKCATLMGVALHLYDKDFKYEEEPKVETPVVAKPVVATQNSVVGAPVVPIKQEYAKAPTTPAPKQEPKTPKTHITPAVEIVNLDEDDSFDFEKLVGLSDIAEAKPVVIETPKIAAAPTSQAQPTPEGQKITTSQKKLLENLATSLGTPAALALITAESLVNMGFKEANDNIKAIKEEIKRNKEAQ